jgi:hypothetical protein
MELKQLSNCKFRRGIVKDGKVMFYCKLAEGELFDIFEMFEICSEFCPLKFRTLGDLV